MKGFITLLEVVLGTFLIVFGLISGVFLLQLLQTYNRGLLNQALASSLAELRMEELRTVLYSTMNDNLADRQNAQVPIANYSVVHPESRVGDSSPQFQDFFMNTQVAPVSVSSEQRAISVWVFYPGILGRQDAYALSTLYSKP